MEATRKGSDPLNVCSDLRPGIPLHAQCSALPPALTFALPAHPVPSASMLANMKAFVLPCWCLVGIREYILYNIFPHSLLTPSKLPAHRIPQRDDACTEAEALSISGLPHLSNVCGGCTK